MRNALIIFTKLCLFLFDDLLGLYAFSDCPVFERRRENRKKKRIIIYSLTLESPVDSGRNVRYWVPLHTSQQRRCIMKQLTFIVSKLIARRSYQSIMGTMLVFQPMANCTRYCVYFQRWETIPLFHS